MERIKLSNNLIFEKLIMVLLFIVYLIVLLSSKFNPYNLVILFVFTLIGYRYSLTSDKLEFDEDFMHIVKSQKEIQIPLKNIYLVSPMPTNFSGFGIIKYRMPDGKYYANFIPRHFSKSFKIFKDFVRKNNPDVVIKEYNYTFSDMLDKDQD